MIVDKEIVGLTVIWEENVELINGLKTVGVRMEEYEGKKRTQKRKSTRKCSSTGKESLECRN